MAKDDTVRFRIEKENKQIIKDAADITHEGNISSFVKEAAIRKAKAIISKKSKEV